MAENLLAKIQIRRGNYIDLPLLKEGEMGYAMDQGRLFIGNPISTYTGTGDIDTYDLDLRFIRPGAPLFVFVDGVELQPQIQYSVQGAKLVFNQPPADGKEIIVGYNSEVSMIGQNQPVDLVRLLPNVSTPAPTGILINYNFANTGIFEFSLSSAGVLISGSFTFLTDGNDAEMNSTVNSLGEAQDCYMLVRLVDPAEGPYLSIDYVNNTPNPFNFYYSARVWKSA